MVSTFADIFTPRFHSFSHNAYSSHGTRVLRGLGRPWNSGPRSLAAPCRTGYSRWRFPSSRLFLLCEMVDHRTEQRCCGGDKDAQEIAPNVSSHVHHLGTQIVRII